MSLSGEATEAAAAAAAAPVDGALWELVCRVFFFKDEARFAKVGVPEAHAPSARAAAKVLTVVEKAAAGPVPDTGLDDEGRLLLRKLGFAKTEAGWAIGPEALTALVQQQNAHRSAFHTRIAALRYNSFAQHLRSTLEEAGKALQRDPEGGFGYEETSEMASRQRLALADFVATYGSQTAFQPALNGLCKALQLQRGSPAVVTWVLEDAALVEMGHEFAIRALELLLLELRFLVRDADPSRVQVARTFVVDPQVSDARLGRLLALFPSAAQQERVPRSGTFDKLAAGADALYKRINQDGAKDASCPQDSLLYPLLSRCDIL